MSSVSVFERTWEAAIELCRRGEVSGRAYNAGSRAPGQEASATPILGWAVRDQAGHVVFTPPESDQQEAVSLFAVARRFAELEHAFDSGEEAPPFSEEPRRTPQDSLREWGLMDDHGNVLSAIDNDPEPLLGYVVKVGNVYAYGVVKQSILSAGTITPTGACENADEARRRASELLMLALVRGATVMGMNGVPAVIDLSAEGESG